MVEIRAGALRLDVGLDDILSGNVECSWSTFYDKDRRSELSALCDKYGSDKGSLGLGPHPYPWPAHTFADFYENRFGHCREYVRNVFECGLGSRNPDLPNNMGPAARSGASLRVWRDYFPNADIYGADIDPATLFQEERIRTCLLDQTSPEAIARMWASLPGVEFDLMIDDGLHSYEAGVCLFEHSHARLKTAGLYIIEDVAEHSMVHFLEYFKGKEFTAEFVTLRQHGVAIIDNSLVVISRRHF